MPDQDPQFFEVSVTVTVRGADENDAINRVAGMLQRGHEKGAGVFPVGNFNARPTADPIRSRQREVAP